MGMRLVRLQGTEGRESIALHPRLTVLSGLSAEMRALLIDTVAGLPRGRHVGDGAIEVHGVMLELTQPNLDLLELSTDLDVVVRAEELPTDPEPAEPQVGRGPVRRGDPSGRPAGLGIQVIGDDSARVAAEERVAVAIAAHLRANESLDGYRRELAEVRDERQRLAVEYDEVRRAVDPFASTALSDASAALQQAVSNITEAAVAQHENERTRVESRLGELIDWSSRLKRELTRLAALDPGPVAEALAAYRQASNPDNSPWPPAAALLDRWNALVETQAATEAPVDGDSRRRLTEFTARRDTAYDAFVEAEQALRRPALDSDLVRELETVHDELFELEDRVRGLGAGRQRRRQAMLAERENELLSALGFESWPAYVAGIHTEGREAERLRRYEVAKAAYELAEDELAREAAAGGGSSLSEAEAIEAERAQLVAETEALLGIPLGGEDPRAALVAHRPPEQVEALQHRMNLAASQLQAALQANGVDMGPGAPTGAQLADAADRWLAGVDELATTLEGARGHHAQIEREIADLAVRLEQLSVPVDTDGHLDASDVVAECRAEVERCRRRVEDHEAATARIVELQHADGPLNRRDEELTALVQRAEHDVAAAQEEVTAAQGDLQRMESEAAASTRRPAAVGGLPDPEALEWYLLARLSAQRSTSFVGSVPLVIDDAFAAWPVDLMGDVFARLERMSDVVQILYLTEDPEVVRWADDLGPERASVVTPAE